MRISFWTLQAAYVSFVNWHHCLVWVGRKLFPIERVVLYDGSCRLCRRTAGFLATSDVLERIRFINIFDTGSVSDMGIEDISPDDLQRDLYVVAGATRRRGFDAYRLIAWRIPILWPLVPLLYVHPIPVVGRAIYRRVADSRHCSLPGTSIAPLPERKPRTRLVLCVGKMLIVTNLLCGLLRISSWPFSIYPTFAFRAPDEVHILTIRAINAEGDIREASIVRGRAWTAFPERAMGLQNQLLRLPSGTKRDQMLVDLWNAVAHDDPLFDEATKVLFYHDTYSTLPESVHDAPLARELISEGALLDTQRLDRSSH